jgi:putative Mn2+ efflux pump MntP
MSFFGLLLIALALGTDAFSLSIGIGMRGVRNRQVLLLSVTVLLFHVFMPLIGVVLGQILGEMVGRYAAWIGAGVIILIGLKMIRQALLPQEQVLSFSQLGRGERASLSKSSNCASNSKLKNSSLEGWGLIILGLSVSLDALSAGLGLGALSVQRLQVTVGVIGIAAGLMTATGLIFGRYLGQWFGTRAELVGGLVLVAVGIKLAI